MINCCVYSGGKNSWFNLKCERQGFSFIFKETIKQNGKILGLPLDMLNVVIIVCGLMPQFENAFEKNTFGNTYKIAIEIKID